MAPLDRSETRVIEVERLCQACGLCCDGSLFGRGRLEPSEVNRVRHRLAVVSSGTSFEQPCAALVERDDGRVCAIYEDRPRTCRSFDCVLVAAHRREGGPLEPRLATIRRAREILATLDPADHAELGEIVATFFARA